MHDYHWSMKQLLRTIVLSGTYRQDSKLTPETLEKDPSNRYWARGPRVRLASEQVRDQALACSGLLSNKMFGKSVMPYQPAGIWNSVWSDEYWKTSAGEDQYRRSVYTYLKRTSPYPAMMTFDGSSREVCLIRRIRTNTPLQALVTLNDSTYLMASRALANKMLRSKGDVAQKINTGYQSLVFRSLSVGKQQALENLYDVSLKKYQQEQKAAAALTASQPSPELAALTVVANALLNLDEVLTKE